MQVSDFMRYVQPPRRMIALDGDQMALGVTQVAWERAGVHVFQRDAGAWTHAAHVVDAGGNRNGRFGASVALQNKLLIVGAPGIGEAGSAFVFSQDEDGVWHMQDSLATADAGKSAAFGSKVSFYAGKIVVGAPGAHGGAGAVFVYEAAADETGWGLTREIKSPLGEEAARFGTSLTQVSDELWVGAPMANERNGVVYRFKDDVDSVMVRSGHLAVDDVAVQTFFGMSISGEGNVAVVGAPGANGGEGTAFVFTRGSNGAWERGGRLLPREPLMAMQGSQISCEEGKAAQFDCEGVDLMAYIPMDGFGAEANERVSDVWGWTDPLSGREYALLGRTAGAAIIDVSNPTLPVYMGLVPANRTSTRDLKVYKDHLFFTGDGAGDHGLVIFDLTRLRTVDQPPSMFEADTIYTGIASAHNLIIDEVSGFAYPVGASQGGETCGGGLHMVDIREPQTPVFAGCFTDTIGLFSDGRTHDGQCVVYTGPDDRYADREICFVSNETALRIVDVTDKSNPMPLAAARYPRVAYVHQGWLTDDHKYFYLDDELDELVGMTGKTRTLVWDIAELDDPVLVGAFEGSTTATDHNLYIKGDRMYQANYQAGLRIWDVSDPEKPVEVGHFDTTPDVANPPGFVGAWTAYPYFESGTIIVSSMNEGLFIVKPSDEQIP